MASWRHIAFLLSFLGLISACTILGMLFWMTASIEKIEHGKTRALVDLKVAAVSETLRLGVEDYAFWTHAHELVEAGDDEGVLEDLGSGATQSALFDQLFILNPDGALQYAFDENLGADGQPLFVENTLRPMWNALRKISPKEYRSVTSVFEHDGDYAFAVAAWITPDVVTQTPDMPLAALFGVVHLGEERLQTLIKDAQITSATLTKFTAQGQRAVADDSVTIYGMNNTPVAILSWEMRSIGARLRQELLPSVALVALSILAICGLAARYFRSQFVALRHANTIATTDQLTGLLNRAGLAEILRSREVSQSLERGHLAAIYLDLNKFKELNDTYGHEAGDIALRVTAERLRSAVRKSDIVVRLGGDEFVCLVIDKEAETAGVSVAQRILELAASPISFGYHAQLITPSVGLAVSAPGTQWETVLSQSDAAMYWAKQQKANYPIVFCKSMDAGNDSQQLQVSGLVA